MTYLVNIMRMVTFEGGNLMILKMQGDHSKAWLSVFGLSSAEANLPENASLHADDQPEVLEQRSNMMLMERMSDWTHI